MTKESGVKSAEKNQELEGDFMLTALETQLNVLTTRIRKVGNNNKSKGRYIPPHEQRKSRDSENSRVKDTLQIILQKISEQDKVLE